MFIELFLAILNYHRENPVFITGMRLQCIKGGLLISYIPDLQVYTVKTPPIGQFSIKTVFSWSQKPSY